MKEKPTKQGRGNSQSGKSEGQKSVMIDCIRYTIRTGIKLHFEFRLDCLYSFQMFSQKSLLLVTVEHCGLGRGRAYGVDAFLSFPEQAFVMIGYAQTNEQKVFRLNTYFFLKSNATKTERKTNACVKLRVRLKDNTFHGNLIGIGADFAKDTQERRKALIRLFLSRNIFKRSQKSKNAGFSQPTRPR